MVRGIIIVLVTLAAGALFACCSRCWRRRIIIVLLTLAAGAFGSFEIMTRRWSINRSNLYMELPWRQLLVINVEPGFIGFTHYRPY